MLDCNKVLTHVFYETDLVTRQKVLKSETLYKCGWLRKNASSFDRDINKNNLVKVRIPLHPQIKVGDILINGSVSIEGMTDGQILKDYDAIVVTEVTYNTNSLPYSNHVHIVGK